MPRDWNATSRDCLETNLYTASGLPAEWRMEEEVRIVEATRLPEMGVSFVARQHVIGGSQIFAWCHLTTHGALTVAAAGEDVVRTSGRPALDLVATGWTVSAKAAVSLASLRQAWRHHAELCRPALRPFFWKARV